MLKFLQYFARFQSFKGSMGRLPAWAKLIVFLFALPGILGIALSIVAFLVSLFALLLLAAPVYRVLQALTGTRPEASESSFWPQEERPVHEVESRDVTNEAASNENVEVKTGVVEGMPEEMPQRPRRAIEVTIIE